MFKDLKVLLQRFPFGPHIQDPFLVILQNEFPLLLMLSFICVELIIISSVSLEKERKVKVALSTQREGQGYGEDANEISQGTEAQASGRIHQPQVN